MKKNNINIEELPIELKSALELPSGAKYYKCALQVNPYSYLKKTEEQITGLMNKNITIK